MLNIFTAERYRDIRQQSLNMARKTRECLTDPEGFWRYAPDDQRVRDAVAKWVRRARNAHAVAMGRRPVIEKTIVINQGEAVSGSLYAA